MVAPGSAGRPPCRTRDALRRHLLQVGGIGVLHQHACSRVHTVASLGDLLASVALPVCWCDSTSVRFTCKHDSITMLVIRIISQDGETDIQLQKVILPCPSHYLPHTASSQPPAWHCLPWLFTGRHWQPR